MEYTVSTVMEKEYVLNEEIASRYLTLYLGVSDWEVHLKTLYARLKRQYGDQTAKEELRKRIAFAVMLPAYDKSTITDPPENLLFKGSHYSQYDQKDWVGLLGEQIKQDKEIEETRNKCKSLGYVYPIVYSPITRQAFNWLFEKAQNAGVVTPQNKQDVVKIFEKLVVAYGGKVICTIFEKEDWKINKKVLNWRSNYFFEKLIYEIYTPEQIFKIKKQELAKTNPRLVRSVRTD